MLKILWKSGLHYGGGEASRVEKRYEDKA